MRLFLLLSLYNMHMKLFRPRPILSDGILELKLVEKHSDSDPDGWGQSWIFDMIECETHRIVGRCDLRKGETPTLDLAGHIGYTVYVPYRGHHYAARACMLLFNYAVYVGMTKLLITCNSDNAASYRTCELAGCHFIKTQVVPVTHELYAQGDRVKAIFEKIL